MQDRFIKRIRKKAKRGNRGWPLATIAFYGPDLGRASKVVVGIVPQAGAAVGEINKWLLDDGDVRKDPEIAPEMLAFMEYNGVLSVVMVDQIIGCPHEEDVDYVGEWCPMCPFWHKRDRFTGKMIVEN